MCDPLTIAGIALTAGSTVANSIAARQQQKARDSALAAERIRQSRLDQEAQALNVASQDRYQEIGTQEGERATKLGDFFNSQRMEAGAANQAAAQEQTVPVSDSSITVREEAKQRGQASQFSDQQGEALGKLRAFGDLFGDIGRLQARDAGRIGQIGGFKRGSNNVLPLELDQASQAGGGAQMLGDILGLGGGLAMNAGLGGASLFGGGGGVKTVDPWAGARTAVKPRTGLVSLYNR